ncbi:MAG TPA: response regulator transcription factor [Roseiarcus sp.]|nr:response regulator transcription factor [Roseiarcus sp.]
MYIIVDERSVVTGGYASSFDREGISSAGIDPIEFRDWIGKVSETDVRAIEAFLIGDCREREVYPRLIRERSRAPVICLNERPSLDQTLELFAAGVDDVLRKPVHVREILARVGAINRRNQGQVDHVMIGELCVYFDGRDPEIRSEPLPLPRRERRILEYIVSNRGRRVTKSQIFNSIYGLFDENVDENVVESHISKLRKKLKHRLGFDPIDSKRFLGYCVDKACAPAAASESASPPAREWLAFWPQGW